MRNNHPFLREPPYRRRETLIERLGFLFVQISRLGFLFPRPAIGFKQAGQAAGKDRALAMVVSAFAIACTRGKPQGSIQRPSLDSASHWLGAERLEGRHPYYCTSIYSVLYSYFIRVYTLSNHSSVLLLYSSSIYTLSIGYILSEYNLLNYSLRS